MTGSSSLIDASVVVPTYNRPERLTRCLLALRTMEPPSGGFDVHVVNDGGIDPTSHPAVRECLASGDGLPEIHVWNRPHGGPSAARNFGASRATGTLLAFTDDDCEPTPTWLKRLGERVQSANRNRPALVGGLTLNALPHNPFSSASQMLVDYLYAHYAANPNIGRFFTSNNMGLYREAFSDSGGFDESFTLAAAEDRELCIRWSQRGYDLLYEPAAVIRHAHEMSLAAFWRQHVTYGIGAASLRRRLDQMGSSLPKVKRSTFYGNLLRHPFRTDRAQSNASPFMLSALLLLSQAAMAYGFAQSARNKTGDRRL